MSGYLLLNWDAGERVRPGYRGIVLYIGDNRLRSEPAYPIAKAWKRVKWGKALSVYFHQRFKRDPQLAMWLAVVASANDILLTRVFTSMAAQEFWARNYLHCPIDIANQEGEVLQCQSPG